MEYGATIGETPAAVIKKCKYTIAMISDPSAALSVGTSNSLCAFFSLCTCDLSIRNRLVLFWVLLRWCLTKMVSLKKFAVEKVTLICQPLILKLLLRSVRFALQSNSPQSLSCYFSYIPQFLWICRFLLDLLLDW